MENNNWKLRYWCIFLGQALSQTGSAVTQFIIMWWITSTIGNIESLATAGIFALLPQALLAPFGGVVADRLSRRFIMICTDLISAICILVMIYLISNHNVELWNVYTLLAIRSSMQAFQGPASQSITSLIVPKNFIPRAAGLNQSVAGFMSVAGAPIGALAIGALPLHQALMIDIITAIIGIFPLIIFTIPQYKLMDEERIGFLKELKEGFSLVWHNPLLKKLFAFEGMAIAIMAPCMVILPLFTTTHFLGGAKSVAIMEGFSGAAMILGGLSVAYINPERKVLTYFVFLSLSCFSIAFASLIPISFFWGAVVLWAISGFTYSFGNAPFFAIIQSTVPNHFQGRVFSLLSTIMGLAAPLGLSILGPVGNSIGIRKTLLLSGCLAGVIFAMGLLTSNILVKGRSGVIREL